MVCVCAVLSSLHAVEMDVTVTVEDVENAIHLFYTEQSDSNVPNELQKQAHQWLVNLQQSTQSWSLFWDLIVPTKAVRVQFFAVSSLHVKIIQNWTQIADKGCELKLKLFQSIFEYTRYPHVSLIRNKLCSCLSALVLQTISNVWSTAIEDIISNIQVSQFPNMDPDNVHKILFDILTMIAEEVNESGFGSTSKKTLRSIFSTKSAQVLNIAYEYLMMASNCENLNEKQIHVCTVAISCKVAWNQYGYSVLADKFLNVLTSLISHMYRSRPDFESLTTVEDDYVDTLFEALNTIAENENLPVLPQLSIQFYYLIAKYYLPIADNELKKEDPNNELIAMIYELVLKLTESDLGTFLKYLYQPATNDLYPLSEEDIYYIIDSLIGCLNTEGSYPIEETRSNITLPFWNHLSEQVFCLASEYFQICLAKLQPFCRKLMPVLLHKCTIHYFDEHFHDEEREMFQFYRQDIADIMVLTYSFIDTTVFEYLDIRLDSLLSDSSTEWREMEAIFYYVTSLVNCLQEDKNIYIEKLLTIICSRIDFSQFHYKLQASGLDVIRTYSVWFLHYPHLFPNAIHFVVESLRKPNIGLNSTMALKDLTAHCSKQMSTYAADIVTEILNVINDDNDNGLQEEDRLRLMYSLGRILNYVADEPYQTALESILGPIFADIRQLLQSSSPESLKLMKYRLEMVSSLLVSLRWRLKSKNSTSKLDDEYQKVLVQTILDLFKKILETDYANDDKMILVICDITRSTITNMTYNSNELTFETLYLVLSLLRLKNNPHTLDFMKKAFTVCDKRPEMAPVMLELLGEIVQIVLNLFNNYSEFSADEFYKNCEFFQEFFNLLSHICWNHTPIICDNSHVNIENVIHFATLCINVSNFDVLKANVKFLVCFIDKSRENYTCVRVLQKFGETIIYKISLHFGGDSPKIIIEHLCGILSMLHIKYPSFLSLWFRNMLVNNDNFPTTFVTKQQKEDFVKKICGRERNKTRLTESVHEFVGLCRGINFALV